jgi:hypothetical protein
MRPRFYTLKATADTKSKESAYMACMNKCWKISKSNFMISTPGEKINRTSNEEMDKKLSAITGLRKKSICILSRCTLVVLVTPAC